MKPKINKLFLFTCGAGEVERVESERRGLASSPPPSRLFVTECRPERPAQARGSTGTTLGADDTNREVRDCQPHIAGPPAPGPAPPIEVRCARETEGAPRSPIPTDRRAPHTTRRTDPGGEWGEGAVDTFLELPASPTPKGKYKNRREEIRERIPPSGLGGGNCPFLPEKLSYWLLSLLRTHPPSHLSLFQLPATVHSSRLIRQAQKVGGAGGETEKARCLQV